MAAATAAIRVTNRGRNPLEFQYRKGPKPKEGADERPFEKLLLPEDGGSYNIDAPTLASLSELPAFRGFLEGGAVVNNKKCAAIEITRPYEN
jgi:hypothetical protein